MPKIKPLSDLTVCVYDAGTFPSLAQKISESVKRCYYHSPFDAEYLSVDDCIIGDGLEPEVERLDDPMDPDRVKEIDLYVFPDRGFPGEQRLLRSLGKAVWGSFRGSEIELYRTKFYKLIEGLGLPVIDYKVIRGVEALANHLKAVKNKWVKVNRFRANMETWHHQDYEHSRPMLDHLAVDFGGVQDDIVFVVQDDIPDAAEIGYDGWSIDGQFPESSFQGYEAKNELYLGTLKKYSALPEEVRYVNEAMSEFLRSHGYRNFWATELRVKDGVPYYIDPTPRMPGQTGEQLLETCSNLAEVIWQGANGNLVKPEFICSCAAEATLHYTAGSEDWKVFRMPEGMEKWVKLYQFCKVGGLHHFPSSKSDELGVILGVGDSPKEAIEHLKENLDALKDEPVSADISGFVELCDQIEEAEKAGMEFSDQSLPEPTEVVS